MLHSQYLEKSILDYFQNIKLFAEAYATFQHIA